MLAEASAVRARPTTSSGAAVICALGVERRCLPREAAALSIIQCGAGETRAEAAAERALAAGARGLVSFGVAGGLAEDAEPGRLLLPKRVVTSRGEKYDVDERWRQRVADVLFDLDIDERPLLAAAAVLATPEEKRRAARTGAAAADLESGAIGAAGRAAKRPFVVVRVVADGPFDRLPADVVDWIDADGNPLAVPVIGAALKASNWPTLLTLARRYRAARRTLEHAARRLAPRGFLLE